MLSNNDLGHSITVSWFIFIFSTSHLHFSSSHHIWLVAPFEFSFHFRCFFCSFCFVHYVITWSYKITHAKTAHSTQVTDDVDEDDRRKVKYIYKLCRYLSIAHWFSFFLLFYFFYFSLLFAHFFISSSIFFAVNNEWMKIDFVEWRLTSPVSDYILIRHFCSQNFSFFSFCLFKYFWNILHFIEKVFVPSFASNFFFSYSKMDRRRRRHLHQ